MIKKNHLVDGFNLQFLKWAFDKSISWATVAHFGFHAQIWKKIDMKSFGEIKAFSVCQWECMYVYEIVVCIEYHFK